MTKNIITVIKESNHPMTDIMVAYMEGQNNDPMTLSLITNTVANSNHPMMGDMMVALSKRF